MRRVVLLEGYSCLLPVFLDLGLHLPFVDHPVLVFIRGLHDGAVGAFAGALGFGLLGVSLVDRFCRHLFSQGGSCL